MCRKRKTHKRRSMKGERKPRKENSGRKDRR
jgi:hypothetical protein